MQYPTLLIYSFTNLDKDCIEDKDECESSPCENGGSCQDGLNGYTCLCQAGFEGDRCYTNTNECESNPCQNGAQCIDGANGYNCTCTDGFTGECN